jgi:hypothetical protein
VVNSEISYYYAGEKQVHTYKALYNSGGDNPKEEIPETDVYSGNSWTPPYEQWGNMSWNQFKLKDLPKPGNIIVRVLLESNKNIWVASPAVRINVTSCQKPQTIPTPSGRTNNPPNNPPTPTPTPTPVPIHLLIIPSPTPTPIIRFLLQTPTPVPTIDKLRL